MFTKRNLFTLQSVNAPDVVEQRNEWIKSLPKLDKSKLVFLDESGINYEGNKVSDKHLAELTGSDKAYLDFYSTHYYNWQQLWFGFPCDKSPEDFGLDGTKSCLIGEAHNNDESEIV